VETRIVKGIVPEPLSPRQVQREFVALLDRGVRIKSVGSTKKTPRSLLSKGYAPRSAVKLFDATFYLTNLREDPNFRFFVAYVHLHPDAKEVYPRIFYKDSSLVWRSPSHYVRSETENWIGKGDIKRVVKNGEAGYYSAEETTNLPYEIQHALDIASRAFKRVPRDLQAVELVLRKAPDDRVEPYQDFSAPRRHAMARKKDRINGGEYIAYFDEEGDPTSQRFVPGFEPDFRDGILEMTPSWSRMYGGEIRKYRILSKNLQVQFQFIASPRLVWIIPPQALTTELSSYGVRTVDVEGDEDVFMPGYEYHFFDEAEDPPAFYSQIPEGYAGRQSTVDPSRADTAPWLERMPVIREFRRRVPLPWPAPALPPLTRGEKTADLPFATARPASRAKC
jgi:hypothetical protein